MNIILTYFNLDQLDTLLDMLFDELSDEIDDVAFNYRGNELLLDLTGCIDSTL